MLDFVPVFPLYFVLVPNIEGGRYGVFGGRLPGNEPSITIFTEAVFAERAKQAECPAGIICKFNTLEALEPHLQLFEKCGYAHVTIDPGTKAGGYAFRTVQEFRRLLELA